MVLAFDGRLVISNHFSARLRELLFVMSRIAEKKIEKGFNNKKKYKSVFNVPVVPILSKTHLCCTVASAAAEEEEEESWR